MAKGNEPGDVVRYDPAPEPLYAAVMIGLLTLVELVFIGLFIGSMILGWNAYADQQNQAIWLAGAMFTLAAILSIYRRYFVPDVMIVKKRKQKYEDLM
ncbi:MAG TPA: hypothetical protein VM889_03150 [Candidatus Thermoplasmatota archaeon]|nr:hypothetical protein [Candidatus Thermoplasmatota archaeon]